MIDELVQFRTAGARRVIGLMSGTSVDGVDAVLTQFEAGSRPCIMRHAPFAIPPVLRESILDLSAGRPARGLSVEAPAAQIAVLDVWIAEVFAEAALECIAASGFSGSEIHLIASHGQTVCHVPEGEPRSGYRATLQLGCGATLAARTGLPVVNGFRQADMAAGGQGAPLVPFADRLLFAQPGCNIVVQNLGGIGNLTFLPGDSGEDVVAFDTGPANILADAAVRHLSRGARNYDHRGKMAARGRISEPLLRVLLDHPFLAQAPPKSTGHEAFGEAYFREILDKAKDMAVSDEDLVATLTAAGPETAVDAYRRLLPCFPDEVILGGGGSLNPVVREHFRRLCGHSAVRTHEEFGIPAQAKEALAFAILGHETMMGRPSNVPTATGAWWPAVLGSLHLPPVRSVFDLTTDSGTAKVGM